jgi:FG-GAP-like repeat
MVTMELAAPAFAADVTFEAQQTYSVPQTPIDIVSADFDGDGNFDLATANRFGTGEDDISVFHNDGSGNFGKAINFGGTVSTLAIGVGKFTGDGRTGNSFLKTLERSWNVPANSSKASLITPKSLSPAAKTWQKD